MYSRNLAFLIALGLCGSLLSAAPEVSVSLGSKSKPVSAASGKVTVRKAPTKEEVLERKAKTPQAYTNQSIKPVKEGEKLETKTQSSLQATSLLLTDGKQWTVLPKRSVLQFADEVKPHIKEGKAGKLVTWAEFERANSAWIRSVPMTEGNLSGKTEITKDTKARWIESKQLLVSTYSGNPVALPLPVSAPKTVQSTPNTAKP